MTTHITDNIESWGENPVEKVERPYPIILDDKWIVEDKLKPGEVTRKYRDLPGDVKEVLE